MANNSNKRRRNRGGRRRGQRITGQVRNAFNGATRRSTADPRGNVSVPWNSVVLYGTVTGTEANVLVSPSDVWTIGGNQGNWLGTSATQTRMEFRISRFNIWNEGGNPVTLTVRDLADVNAGTANQQQLWSGSDYPGRNHWAHIGYEWPRSQRNLALPSNSTTPFVSFQSTGVTFYKIYVLWRMIPATSTFSGSTTLASLPEGEPLVHSHSQDVID